MCFGSYSCCFRRSLSLSLYSREVCAAFLQKTNTYIRNLTSAQTTNVTWDKITVERILFKFFNWISSNQRDRKTIDIDEENSMFFLHNKKNDLFCFRQINRQFQFVSVSCIVVSEFVVSVVSYHRITQYHCEMTCNHRLQYHLKFNQFWFGYSPSLENITICRTTSTTNDAGHNIYTTIIKKWTVIVCVE